MKKTDTAGSGSRPYAFPIINSFYAKRYASSSATRKKVAGVTGAFKVHYLVFLDGALFKGLLQQVMVKAATNINS